MIVYDSSHVMHGCMYIVCVWLTITSCEIESNVFWKYHSQFISSIMICQCNYFENAIASIFDMGQHYESQCSSILKTSVEWSPLLTPCEQPLTWCMYYHNKMLIKSCFFSQKVLGKTYFSVIINKAVAVTKLWLAFLLVEFYSLKLVLW